MRSPDQLTAIWAAAEPRPVEEADLSYLATLPTGSVAASMLTDLDPTGVSGRNRVSLLQARIRSHSHFQALIYEDIAAIHDACTDLVDPELAWEAAASEIRAALRLTRRAADHHLDLALALRDRLPAVLAALKAGDIDQRRATVIVKATIHLPDDTARLVADQILPRAGQLTTGQLRQRLHKLAIETDPDTAKARYEQAIEQRRVELEPTDQGTTDLLLLNLAPDRAAAAADHINYLAKQHRKHGETRTIDQLRADIAIDLLCGSSIAAPTRHGVVDIHVDLKTLTELTNTPGELAGYGPVIADIARQVAANQTNNEWRWTLDDPETGLPTANGTTRRRPTTSQTRTVQTHNPTCIFPGCRMPSTQTDLDHTTPWAQGGPTTINNLAPLCRHHHTRRHQHGWKHRALTDGDHLWTSPLGHTYTTTGQPP